MAKHTPGPWYVVDRHHTPWTDALVIGSDHEGLQAVAYTTRGFEGSILPSGEHDERSCAWANARLIAAAPDLVSALIEARESLADGLESECGELEAPGSKRDRALIARIDTALSKALGEGE